ncbi:MAG: LemA family protein, partial [Aestuariivirgaceae bacterium]
MDPEARIQQMSDDGLLSDKQAQMLRDSLAGRSGQDAVPHSGVARVRVIFLALAAVAAIVAIVMLATGGGGPEAIQDVSETLNQPGGHGEMNRTFSTILAICLMLIVPVLLWGWMHNSLVAREERVFEAWAQTESAFQRRADLIPNLVETVTRFLKHERETLTDVTIARSRAAGQITEGIDKLLKDQKATSDLLGKGRAVVEDDALMLKLFNALSGLKSNMANVMAVSENYPDLKSSDQFLQLQAQLEGTENRINVARMRFNEAVGEFNSTMRSLPWSLVASVSSFKRKAYFRS